MFAGLLVLLSGGAVHAQPFGSPVKAPNGMVVSAHEEATRAGVETLEAGGNAVDAAVATGFALAVTYPVAGNIGGGGFMVIRLADGSATTFDYREVAPAAATRTMYLDEEGNFVPELSTRGHLASGVPGAVAGLLKAHGAYGRLPREAVLAPAIRLAEEGFVLSERQADRFNGACESFVEYEGTKRYFTKGACEEEEEAYEADERFVQRDLAAVLRRVSEEGRDGFYTGETADLIVAEMERGGGLITHEDLAAYEAVERPPIRGEYRGYGILSMPPPSSGGVALVQLLDAVEPYDLGAMGWGSSATLHLMGEAMRRAFADRAHWLGDTDFVEVPVEVLTSKYYTRERMANFKPDQADTSADVGPGEPVGEESMETTHYSVVDAEGHAVSVTTTINGGYGSRVVVDGAGFFLNNEMDDFSAKPGVPNMFGLVGAEANAIQPGKRMLSSMTPTIVTDPQGRLFLVVGSPGGPTIITTVFQVILNVVDHGMNIQEAVAVPRVHHQWLPDVLFHEPFALPRDVAENLEARGWVLDARNGYSGRADAILVDYGSTTWEVDPSGLLVTEQAGSERMLHGGADPRGEDLAAGY